MVRHEYARARVQGSQRKTCRVLSILLAITYQEPQCISCLVIGRSWLDILCAWPCSRAAAQGLCGVEVVDAHLPHYIRTSPLGRKYPVSGVHKHKSCLRAHLYLTPRTRHLPMARTYTVLGAHAHYPAGARNKQ